jgi:hypothetical protein
MEGAVDRLFTRQKTRRHVSASPGTGKTHVCLDTRLDIIDKCQYLIIYLKLGFAPPSYQAGRRVPSSVVIPC